MLVGKLFVYELVIDMDFSRTVLIVLVEIIYAYIFDKVKAQQERDSQKNIGRYLQNEQIAKRKKNQLEKKTAGRSAPCRGDVYIYYSLSIISVTLNVVALPDLSNDINSLKSFASIGAVALTFS